MLIPTIQKKEIPISETPQLKEQSKTFTKDDSSTLKQPILNNPRPGASNAKLLPSPSAP